MRLTYKSIIGKTILIGLTYLNPDETVNCQIQLHGEIVKADKNSGIVISVFNAEKVFAIAPFLSDIIENNYYSLPPQLSALSIAKQGEYKLRTTNEIVIDPYFLSTWTIKTPTTK